MGARAATPVMPLERYNESPTPTPSHTHPPFPLPVAHRKSRTLPVTAGVSFVLRNLTDGRSGQPLTLIAVSAGVVSSSGFALLLSFAGVLAGTCLIFVGVRIADDPTAPVGQPGLLAAGVRCLRRNLGLAGLLLASSAASATAAADRETATVLCLCAFALLLLGLSLVSIGVLLLGEQEQ